MRKTRKHLALLLAAALCLALLPLGALASEEADATVEEIAESIDEPAEAVESPDAVEDDDEGIAEIPAVEIDAELVDADAAEAPALDGAGIIESGSCGENLTWTLTDDGTLTISGTGYFDYFIKGEPWQEYRDFITDVVFGPGTTNMDYILTSLSNLKSVTLSDAIGCGSYPDGDEYSYLMSSINSLYGLSSLQAIYVSNDNPVLTSVDGVLFSKDGKSLYVYPAGRTGSYEIPDGVTTIDYHSFLMCEKLTGITFPESVTNISAAFGGCIGLTEVVLPASLEWLAPYAFCDCSNLGKITIPNGIDYIGIMTFARCTSLTTIEIPKGVTCIGIGAFSNCGNLKSITIPSSVEVIDSSAFEGCGQLEDVYYSGTEEQWNKIMTDLFSELTIKIENFEYYQPISQTTEIDGVVYSNYDLSCNSELGAATLHFAEGAEPEAEASVALSDDCKTAQITGDFTGLYARVALILNNNGQTGLYVTQVTINPDGTIVIPQFQVPGLTVTGVNISLVGTLDDISSATPKTAAMTFRML